MSLVVKSLSYIHPDNEVLFDRLNLSLPKGIKAALVGINGAGKSTLLKLIAQQLQPSSGEAICSEKPWYVPQHLGEFDGLTIAQALLVDQKLNGLKAILEGDADPKHFLALNDDWEIEDKVSAVLENWGLNNLPADQLLGQLSGGQKTKVFLAGMELHSPEVILLDEPSNHLDFATRKKLYAFILESKATILVISHDRSLLDMMNRTLELSKLGIEVFGGNFEFYQQQKAEKVNALQAQLNEQSKTLKQSEKKAKEMAYQRQLQEIRGKTAGKSNSMPRIVAGGLKSKSERSTAKVMDAHQDKVANLAEHMRETRAQIQQYQVLKINLPVSGLHPGKLLIDAEELQFGYNNQSLWDALSFEIRSGDRLQILGDNGTGKTTLLKIITGQLEPTRGQIFRQEFSFLYLDQEYSMIDSEKTVYEQLESFNTGGMQEHELKAFLIASQFEKEAFDRKCIGLSGGEKMKLSLCCLAISNSVADVLILDEPTNNLDIQSLEVLISAIKSYAGTLLVISHDDYFRSQMGIERTIFLK